MFFVFMAGNSLQDGAVQAFPDLNRRALSRLTEGRTKGHTYPKSPIGAAVFRASMLAI
jgi:hypothetical protein